MKLEELMKMKGSEIAKFFDANKLSVFTFGTPKNPIKSGALYNEGLCTEETLAYHIDNLGNPETWIIDNPNTRELLVPVYQRRVLDAKELASCEDIRKLYLAEGMKRKDFENLVMSYHTKGKLVE